MCYFLAAATSYASTFKTAEQAGLPNITGTIYVGRTENAGGGAFKKEANTGSYSSHHDARDGGHYSFDASRSNSIYGKSSTVTPKNYSANVFIYAGRKKQ